jgi:hypothetical protein
MVAASNQGQTLALAAAPTAADGEMQLTGAGTTADQNGVAGSAAEPNSSPGQSLSQSPSTPVGSTVASQPAAAEMSASSSNASNQNAQQPTAQTTPGAQAAAAPASTKVLSPTLTATSSRRLWIVGGLLLAAVVLLLVAILPAVRRYKFTVPGASRSEPRAETAVLKPGAMPVHASGGSGNGFGGGPRQVSLQLKPWEPALRQNALSSATPGTAVGRLKGLRPKPSLTPARRNPQSDEKAPMLQPFFESVGPVLEQPSELAPATAARQVEPELTETGSEFVEASVTAPQTIDSEIVELPQEPVFVAHEANEFFEPATEEAMVPMEQPNEVFADAQYAWPAEAASAQLEPEPVDHHQPDQVSFPESEAFLEPEVFAQPEAPVVEASTDAASEFQYAIPAQPVFPETTIPATMPETTQTPPAPITKAPAPMMAKPQPPAPVPAAAMQTSVQLTFSFEIVAMQLTPSFKMGVLKVRPISKLVTMRLPSPQRAQSALNLQVAFEVAKIQPIAGALGTIRVVPSQQQRPPMGGMPSFAVAGLQLVANSETAPVQLTPSPQGRASVFITVPFQISTLEFSPSLEIGSVTLNSNSKQVIVQLPGATPGPSEGAPMFEIANLELNEGGEIVMMQLNLLGGPKRA